MRVRKTPPFMGLKIETKEDLIKSMHRKTIESKAEKHIALSNEKKWDYNEFVRYLMEMLVVLRARDAQKR